MTPPPTNIDGTDITGATIDGQEVAEITIDGQTVFPKSITGFVVDDFADNKLTNRDNFSGTPLNPQSLEPTVSGFKTRSRPEYVQTDSASVSAGELSLSQFVFAFVLAPIPSFNGELEWDVNYTADTSVDFVGFVEGTTLFNGNAFKEPQDGFGFQVNAGTGTFAAINRYDSGSLSRLATTGNASHGLTISGTINTNGSLTLDNGSISTTTSFNKNIDHFMISTKEGSTIPEFIIK
jgi:hypothetical protein